MPRETPSTPGDDLAARSNWRGCVRAGGVLTDELVEFCQSGVSIAVATVRGDGRPLAGLALASTIDDDGTVRLLMRQPANSELLDRWEAGAAIAATFSEPRTHRSIQLKGSRADRVAVGGDDLSAVARQSTRFRGELEFVGYPVAFSAFYCAYRPEEIVAVEFMPAHAFVQTPGPGAGSSLGS